MTGLPSCHRSAMTMRCVMAICHLRHLMHRGRAMVARRFNAGTRLTPGSGYATRFGRLRGFGSWAMITFGAMNHVRGHESRSRPIAFPAINDRATIVSSLRDDDALCHGHLPFARTDVDGPVFSRRARLPGGVKPPARCHVRCFSGRMVACMLHRPVGSPMLGAPGRFSRDSLFVVTRRVTQRCEITNEFLVSSHR